MRVREHQLQMYPCNTLICNPHNALNTLILMTLLEKRVPIYLVHSAKIIFRHFLLKVIAQNLYKNGRDNQFKQRRYRSSCSILLVRLRNRNMGRNLMHLFYNVLYYFDGWSIEHIFVIRYSMFTVYVFSSIVYNLFQIKLMRLYVSHNNMKCFFFVIFRNFVYFFFSKVNFLFLCFCFLLMFYILVDVSAQQRHDRRLLPRREVHVLVTGKGGKYMFWLPVREGSTCFGYW